MLGLLSKVQDSLGRTVELIDVLPAEGEILWDLDKPNYVQVTAEQDSLLLDKGDTAMGWICTEAEILHSNNAWDSPFSLRPLDASSRQAEGAGTSTLLSTRVFLHLASYPNMASRFVKACAAYGMQHGIECKYDVSPNALILIRLAEAIIT